MQLSSLNKSFTLLVIVNLMSITVSLIEYLMSINKTQLPNLAPEGTMLDAQALKKLYSTLISGLPATLTEPYSNHRCLGLQL